MTPRTENIIGAVIIFILLAALAGVIGYAVPNYYVYFVTTIREGLAQ